MGLKVNSSNSLTEVKIPSSSELHITKISKDQQSQAPVEEQTPITQEQSSRTDKPDQSETDLALINLLPEEMKELAIKDESYRNALKQQYLNQETESTPTEPTQGDIENPYERLMNDPNHLEKFNPNVLPEGVDNPYRKLLENKNK